MTMTRKLNSLQSWNKLEKRNPQKSKERYQSWRKNSMKINATHYISVEKSASSWLKHAATQTMSLWSIGNRIPRQFGSALWVGTTKNTVNMFLWRVFQSIAFPSMHQRRVHPNATQWNSRHVRLRYERSLLWCRNWAQTSAFGRWVLRP